VSLSLPEAGRTQVFGVDRVRLLCGQLDNRAIVMVADSPLAEIRLPRAEAAGSGHVDVVAANDLALHWLQTPPARVASLAELHLVAQVRCAHLYGGAPGTWRIAADWRIDKPFVCAALPQDIAARVEDRLANSRRHVRWHSAWGVVARVIAQSFPANGWSAMRTPARTVLWHCRAGDVDCIASWPTSAQVAGEEAAHDAVRRMIVESSRVEDAPAGELYWLDLAIAAKALADQGPIQGVTIVSPDDARLPATEDAFDSEACVALRLCALLDSGSP
jgi:hypothetical protein